MNPEENPLENALKMAMEIIIKEIYGDIKTWAIAGITAPYKHVVKNIKHKTYSDFQSLRSDIEENKISNGDFISIKCKISSFGTNMKPTYIGPLAGINTQNRLGPPLLHPNPILGMMAQLMSNLKPVGIYPPVSNKISQVKLYPFESNAVGFFGMTLGVNDLVPSFNALVKSEMVNNAHKSCKLTGRIRCISQQDFVDAGYSLEKYEIIRSVRDIWFFDAAHQDANMKIIDNEVKELWGALYSGGHIEFEGELPYKALIKGYVERLNPLVQELQVVQNQAKNMEINIFGKGFRMVQHINFPIYALHYDIDIGTDYLAQKNNYDKILNEVLLNIKDTCENNSVSLVNPLDLDFNYTSECENYKLLESKSANSIVDPLALAIREWNKKHKN